MSCNLSCNLLPIYILYLEVWLLWLLLCLNIEQMINVNPFIKWIHSTSCFLGSPGSEQEFKHIHIWHRVKSDTEKTQKARFIFLTSQICTDVIHLNRNLAMIGTDSCKRYNAYSAWHIYITIYLVSAYTR